MYICNWENRKKANKNPKSLIDAGSKCLHNIAIGSGDLLPITPPLEITTWMAQ